MSRKLRPLVALALVALVSAGCGANASSETGTASSTGSASHSGTSGSKTLTAQGTAVTFAECMRRNGVSDFPDPDAKGAFVYAGNASPAVFAKAADTCRELEPPGALRAQRTPKQQSDALKFAQCMRDNGVKDFPDPANGERLVDRTHLPRSAGTPGGMSILTDAMQKCAVTPWERQWGG